MLNKNIKKKIFITFIVIFIAFSSICFIFQEGNINKEIKNLETTQKPLVNSSPFSREDYKSFLIKEESGLGEISVLDILFNQSGFNKSAQFEQLEEDLGSGALNVSYLGTYFIETIKNASRNFLKSEYIDNNQVRIKMNESLQVFFNNDTSDDGLEGFMVYLPRLADVKILEVYLNNSLLKKEENYSIVENNFLKFDYSESYPDLKGEFLMNIIYSYDLTFVNWEIIQKNIDDLIATQPINNFTAEYQYQFLLEGIKYGSSPENEIAADDLKVSLLIDLLDNKKLDNFSLAIKTNQEDIEDYQISNGIFNISIEDDFTANLSSFKVNFSSNFKVGFQDPVNFSWGIDRLFSGNSIRQRFYFPKIFEGPEHLLLKFVFYEETILADQIMSFSSQFGREIYNLNVSQVLNMTEMDDPPIDQGILIYGPSLILGERACPFNIKYQVNETLRIIITDNINMPLWNLDVKIYYYEALYGTYISKNFSQPIAPLIANENGEMILDYIPNGNYKVEIYYRGNKVKTAFIDTSKNIHYIRTNIPHFPSVILAFGLLSAIILSLGIIIYRRNKKRI